MHCRWKRIHSYIKCWFSVIVEVSSSVTTFSIEYVRVLLFTGSVYVKVEPINSLTTSDKLSPTCKVSLAL